MLYLAKDISHGRQIIRVISVYEGQKIEHKNYQHVQSIIKIKRSGKRGKKEYEETIYYISSRKETAETFAEKIQSHWKIENMVHWVKDAIFKEDKRRIMGFESIKQGINWLRKKWKILLLNPEII